MASIAGNRKVARVRGDEWKEKLSKGRMDGVLRPSLMKIVRLERMMTQEDVAKTYTGLYSRVDKRMSKIKGDDKLSEASYQAIERGERPVSATKALRLAKIFNKNREDLFMESKPGKYFVKLVVRSSVGV